MIFHAGTEWEENKLISTGGRVLLLATDGGTIQEAQQKIYEKLENKNTAGLFYRNDIGHRAISN